MSIKLSEGYAIIKTINAGLGVQIHIVSNPDGTFASGTIDQLPNETIWGLVGPFATAEEAEAFHADEIERLQRGERNAQMRERFEAENPQWRGVNGLDRLMAEQEWYSKQ